MKEGIGEASGPETKMSRDGTDLRRQAAKCSEGERESSIGRRGATRQGKHKTNKRGQRTIDQASETRYGVQERRNRFTPTGGHVQSWPGAASQEEEEASGPAPTGGQSGTEDCYGEPWDRKPSEEEGRISRL